MAQENAASAAPRGIPLGRPLGIPIYLAPSWILISLFIAVSTAGELSATPDTRDYVIGAVVAILIAASVLAHELGHSVVSLALGIPIRRITLFLFGGYAEISRESEDAREEYLIAIAGPLVSLFLGGVGYALYFGTSHDTLQPIGYFLGRTNFALAVLNLLPGLPLDGGRVLRAIVWARAKDKVKATRVAVIGGKSIAVLLGGTGIAGVAAGEYLGLVNLMLAAFLWSSASAMGRHAEVVDLVPQLNARTLAHPAVPVASGTPLAEALRQGRAARSWLVAVDSYGRPAGVVSAAAVDAVPAARRPWVTVGDVSRTIVPELTLKADLQGQDVLDALRAHPAPEYLVVEDDGAVVGVLATRDVAHAVDPRTAAA